MKKIIFMIFTSLIYFGCKKQEDSINEKLYNIIISYQKEVPIPLKKGKKNKKSPENVYNYVYEINFDSNKDTVMSITLKPQGSAFTSERRMSYGILW